jgi:4-amino-4-deoxy-L-arabinose transferase-like glycosyltransferase
MPSKGDSMRFPSRPGRGQTTLAILFVTTTALILLPYLLRLSLLTTRGFDPDEFEHLHGAWRVSRGEFPYRDFFEHHTPGVHFFLAPFFAFYRVDESVADAFGMIFLARRLMWLWTGAILAGVVWLGRRWWDWRVGWIGAFFLGNTIMFLEKTLEVRPDLLSVAFWMVSLTLWLDGFRSEAASGRRVRGRFAASGFAFGVAVFCTQKMLFAVPGFALVNAWYLCDPRGHGAVRERFGNALAFLAGSLAPLALTFGYFAARGGLDAFIEFNFALNLRWRVRFAPWGYLTQLVRQNPFEVALAGVGTLRFASTAFRRESYRRGDFGLVLNAVGLIANLFVMPVPYRQYYLMFLPLTSLLAAAFLVDGFAALSRLRETRSIGAVAAVSVFVVLTAVGLRFAVGYAKPQILVPTLYPALVGIGLAGVLMFTLIQQRDLALTTLVIVLSAYPLKQMRDAFHWRNDAERDEIAYVIENTAPTDTFMDGWTGRGVFRPHAFFYWFLHGEIRAMLTDSQKAALLEDLRSGRVAPSLIAADGDLRGVSPELTAFLDATYEPVGKGTLAKRRTASSSTTSLR